MRRLWITWGSISVGIVLLLLLVQTDLGAGDNKPASAEKLAKEWLYPKAKGDDSDLVSNGTGPLDEKQKNLDLTSIQFAKTKDSFEDVWNYYAGKCGYDKKWKKSSYHFVGELIEDKGQRMVIDRKDGETHFGFFTKEYVIHVNIRKAEKDQVDISILSTLK